MYTEKCDQQNPALMAVEDCSVQLFVLRSSSTEHDENMMIQNMELHDSNISVGKALCTFFPSSVCSSSVFYTLLVTLLCSLFHCLVIMGSEISRMSQLFLSFVTMELLTFRIRLVAL